MIVVLQLTNNPPTNLLNLEDCQNNPNMTCSTGQRLILLAQEHTLYERSAEAKVQQEELGYQQILSVSFSLYPGLKLSIFFMALVSSGGKIFIFSFSFTRLKKCLSISVQQ